MLLRSVPSLFEPLASVVDSTGGSLEGLLELGEHLTVAAGPHGELLPISHHVKGVGRFPEACRHEVCLHAFSCTPRTEATGQVHPLP